MLSSVKPGATRREAPRYAFTCGAMKRTMRSTFTVLISGAFSRVSGLYLIRINQVFPKLRSLDDRPRFVYWPCSILTIFSRYIYDTPTPLSQYSTFNLGCYANSAQHLAGCADLFGGLHQQFMVAGIYSQLVCYYVFEGVGFIGNIAISSQWPIHGAEFGY